MWSTALIVASGVAAGSVSAQTYPNRPVRVIVPLAAGGGMDAISRGLAQRLSDNLGQNFVIDNRPGAGGVIAMDLGAASAPDGHTLLVVSATSVIHPILYKARFDVLRDFVPVAQLTAQGYVLAVHPSIPARSVGELIQYLRAHPGKLNFASSGIASPIHLCGELFMAATGTKMVHVPFKGMGPAYADLLAGNIELAFPTVISSQPHIRAGRLRGLAVTGARRTPVLPELPTVAEAGVPGYAVVNWYGLVAPLGTPAAIVERVNHEVDAAMRHAETARRLAADGSEAATGTAAQFRQHILAEREKWTRVIRAAGIRGE